MAISIDGSLQPYHSILCKSHLWGKLFLLTLMPVEDVKDNIISKILCSQGPQDSTDFVDSRLDALFLRH